MNRIRVHSAPSLVPHPTHCEEREDYYLEGISITIKLLMKLIENHQTTCGKDQNKGQRILSMTAMMTILDNLKTQIQNSESCGNIKTEAEMRCSKTEHDLSGLPPRVKRTNENIDEKEKLREELNTSFMAICSSLGKEKEIMANELARKVQELGGMEELVNDLKTQNETLSLKVKEFASKSKEIETDSHVALLERNKALSEKLFKLLDGYKSMKRKVKEVDEENRAMRATMEEMRGEVGACLERIQGFKQRMEDGGESMGKVEEEITELEHMFECFQIKVSKYGQMKGECVKSKFEIGAQNPVVLA